MSNGQHYLSRLTSNKKMQTVPSRRKKIDIEKVYLIFFLDLSGHYNDVKETRF